MHCKHMAWKGYKSALLQKSVSSHGRACGRACGRRFDVRAFIGAQRRSAREFLGAMRHSQLFEVFVRERLLLASQGYPTTCPFEAKARPQGRAAGSLASVHGCGLLTIVCRAQGTTGVCMRERLLMAGHCKREPGIFSVVSAAHTLSARPRACPAHMLVCAGQANIAPC